MSQARYGFNAVIAMLEVADEQFRDALLRRLRANDPEAADALEEALGCDCKDGCYNCYGPDLEDYR